MKNPIISEINIYPVKSLGGISLESVQIEKTGLQYDRRWMLVDNEGKFYSQRTLPKMTLLKVSITENLLKVKFKDSDMSELQLPLVNHGTEPINVTIWRDKCKALLVSNEADIWFSEILKTKCRLVYMPFETERIVNSGHLENKNFVSFADGFPFLLIGQASLDDLNRRLKNQVKMKRFRTNFVVSGSEPYAEDTWKKIRIGHNIFHVVKPCSRCVITTVNPSTGAKEKEPLQTLAAYRKVGNEIFFGQNLVHEDKGKINVGDQVEILEWK